MPAKSLCVKFFAFLFIAFYQVVAQIGEWRNYTDMKNVRSVAFSNGALFAGTNGGLLVFYPESERFIKFTKVEGFADIDIVSVEVKGENIFAGLSNGIIELLQFHSYGARISHISDIYSSVEPDKKINFLKIYGDTLFIGTNFGLLTFRISKTEFMDTYRRIFADLERVKVFDIALMADTILVATSEGIAYGYRFSQLLVAPSGWRTIRRSGGFTSVEVFAGKVYAGNSEGLFVYDASGFVKIFSGVVRKIKSVGDSLIFSTGQEIYSFKDGNFRLITSLEGDYINDFEVQDGKIFTGMNSRGIGIFDGRWKFYQASGPNSNLFQSLAIDRNGNLWAASSKFLGKGFYKFDGKEWKNFSRRDYPKISDDCYRVRVGKNFVWVGTWGGGLIKVDKNDSLKVLHTAEGLIGVPENLNFVVIPDVAEDSDGNLWALIYKAYNRVVLAVLRNDSILTYFSNAFNSSYTNNLQIEIDERGRKWIVSEHGFLFVFDDNGTLFDKSDDVWLGISKTDGLNGQPTVVRFDNRGDVWVGTDLGLNVIVNLDNPKSSGSIRSVFPLRDLYVNDIAVDAVNNKWVATKNGVWVLNPDGTAIIAFYNVDNSPLLSNDVKSIAIDHSNGTVYFGTDRGLTSLKTVFVKPLENFVGELKFYPNPFNPKQDVYVTIDGLVQNSTVKIFTISGELVRTIETPGGRIAIWDGKDFKGEFVPTGVYIVAAYNEDGTKVGLGKIAVLRD